MGFVAACTNHQPELSNVTIDPDQSYAPCADCGAMLDIRGPFKAKVVQLDPHRAVVVKLDEENEPVCTCTDYTTALRIAAALNLLEP